MNEVLKLEHIQKYYGSKCNVNIRYRAKQDGKQRKYCTLINTPQTT